MNLFIHCALMLLFIPLNSTTDIFDSTQNEDFCSRIECEPIICEDGYSIKVDTAGPGNCCSACIRTAKYDETCDINFEDVNGSSNCERNITDPIPCIKGLQCKNNKCSLSPAICFEKFHNYTSNVKEDWMWEPQCDDLGSYKPKQCKKYKCYCRLPDGTRIFGKAYADEEKAENMNCACSLMERDLENAALSTGIFNHVICQSNGNFLKMQCLQNLCFCVNETSAEVQGIILPKTLKRRLPCYDNETYSANVNRLCQLQRTNEERLAFYYFTKGFDIHNMPLIKCEADGSYESKQCDRENCQCYDPDGKPIVGASTPVSIGEESVGMNCYCARDVWEITQSGNSGKPKCKNSGNYDSLQCIGKNCYCVDEDGDQEGNPKSMDNIEDLACVNGKVTLNTAQSTSTEKISVN